MTGPICSCSAFAKVLKVPTEFHATRVDNVRPGCAAMSLNNNSWGPLGVARVGLHSDFFTWHQCRASVHRPAFVVVVLLGSLGPIEQVSDFQGVVGLWDKQLLSCREFVSGSSTHEQLRWRHLYFV